MQPSYVRVLSHAKQVDALACVLHWKSNTKAVLMTRTMLAYADWKSNTKAVLIRPRLEQRFFMKIDISN